MRTRNRIPAVILSVLKAATVTAAHWTIPARPSVSTARQQNVSIIPITNAMRKPFPSRADMQRKADRPFAGPLNVNVNRRGMCIAMGKDSVKGRNAFRAVFSFSTIACAAVKNEL